ncbi:DUF2218 domain-containing protein [Stakelama sp. CBK3Z-3]|uniref:DUF2218 domain-containing protein n=1 Tax=Stakelama flava TaxID=2860338 RepID=A0ABS6XKQ6_9SPHN|nr:DUF2218 domain-containing protein [Stakelama flava]MBW4330792.1 DUF2218 domain-containing protein [Stakelama flava]
MAVTSKASVVCEKPSRYLKQLVSHWRHRMPASWEDSVATFPFPDGPRATMAARNDGIDITLLTDDQEKDEVMRGVIERHLDRFAFREAPLDFDWSVNC